MPTGVDEPPDSESNRALEQERRLESIEASYGAAREAIGLARAYRREPGSTGRRERECLEEVVRLRSAIAALRVAARVAQAAEIPGLRKADVPAPSPALPKRAG